MVAHDVPPTHQLAVHDVPLHQPATNIPSTHQPTVHDVPFTHQLAVHDVPLHQPAANIPFTHQPAAHNVPSTHQPITHDVPHHSKGTDNVSQPQPTHSDSGDEFFDTSPSPPPPPQPVASHSSNQLAVEQSESMTTDTAGTHEEMFGSEQKTHEMDKAGIEPAKTSTLKDNEKRSDTSPTNLRPNGRTGKSSDPAADNNGNCFETSEEKGSSGASISENNMKNSMNQTTKKLNQTGKRDESFRGHSMDSTTVVEHTLKCNTCNGDGTKVQQKMTPAPAACASYAGQENVSSFVYNFT